MSQVLYRKHRSQTFDQLIGQQHITSILKNAVAQGQTAHAYLFHGPRGLGKTSTARILAKAVNCLDIQEDGNPCCKCANCLSVQEGKFLDLIEIDAASNRGIDQIRELKEKIEFSPTEGKYKVYIIDEVHMLTTEAFNALLKTLEEPPDHAIFILATTEIYKIPATIMSRCQRFDFRLGSDDNLKDLLVSVAKKESLKLEDGAVDLILENAQGSYRDLLSLLDVIVSGQEKSDDPSEITEKEVRSVLGLAEIDLVYMFIDSLVSGKSSEALKLVEDVRIKGVNLSQFVKFNLAILRKILVGEISKSVEISEEFTKKLDLSKTLQLMNLFVEAEKRLKDSVIPTLPLEVLIAKSVGLFGGEEVLVSNVTSVDSKENLNKKTNINGGDPNGSSNKVDEPKVETVKPVEVKDEDLEEETEEDSDSEESEEMANNSTVEVMVQDGSNGSENQDSKDATVEESVSNTSSDNPPVISGLGVDLTKDEIEKNWRKIQTATKQLNGHLFAFMCKAKISNVSDGIISLNVPFDFHKDCIESNKSKEILKQVFGRVLGCNMKVECKVCEDIKNESAEDPKAEAVVMDEEGNIESGMDIISSKPDAVDTVTEVFGNDLVGM